MKALDLAEKAKSAIADKKGEDVHIIDVREISNITDYYIITSGSSAPHLKAMYGGVQEELQKEGVSCYRKAGEPDGGWMVLDYIDVVIHIFSREARDYYSIEELWAQVPQID